MQIAFEVIVYRSSRVEKQQQQYNETKITKSCYLIDGKV